MNSIKNFLAPDHHQCDDLFAAAEAAVAGRNWGEAEPAFARFRDALRHHFSMEEAVMFPAFENRTGVHMGPTEMMRMEHLQMKELLDQLEHSLARRDNNAYLGDAETLLIIMQQHNIKEEQILYPMADKALATECEEVIGRMRAVA